MKKGLFIIFGCILVLSMVLVACNSTTSTTATTKTTTTTTTTTKPTTTTPATTTTVDMYGGTWKEAGTSAPARPIGYPPEANSDSYIYSSPCLETLVEAQQDGTISPLLATNWTVADDGSSVMLSLRKGVKFHDGSDFNADVCKWNLDLEIAAKAANASSWKSVDKIDDYTIRINVTSYQNIMMYNLSTVVSQQISKANVDKNGISGAEWNPIGTGAFTFVSYETGSKITYKRNPNYWDPSKPYLEGLTFSIIPDSTVMKLAFQKGDINRIAVAGGSDANSLIQAGFSITTAPGGTFFLAPNSGVANSPWADIKVRQAGFYALDRITLAKALGLGYLNPAYQLYPGYSDSKIPGLALSDNDTAKAKDLLNQAGYPSGFKTTIHNATRGVPTDYMVATAAMLRAIGIDVTTDSPESGRYTTLRSQGWNDGLLNHGTAAAVNKNSVFQTYFMGLDFVSLKIPAAFTAAANASINSKTYDQKLVQAAFKILSDDVTVIPYAEQVQCCFYQKGAHSPDSATFGNLLPHWRTLWIEKSAR